jgi:hypothetical protein
MNELTGTASGNEISAKQVFKKARRACRYLWRKQLFILLTATFGAVVGFGSFLLKNTLYTATCTFVLDDGNKTGSTMMSQYAGLASLAGINLGSGNGMFEGDNIINLYKSRLMIERTLLRLPSGRTDRRPLIDFYINFNRLRAKWKTRDHIDTINFSLDPVKFNRKQDSLITDISDEFNEKYLRVFKPDKKLNLIEVDFTAKNERFAKEFTELLVQTVNDFYIKTMTQKAFQNVLVLQRQSDSVRNILDRSISGMAYAKESAPNANPLLYSLEVPSQRKEVDIKAGGAIYSAIVQNLEIARINLRQATPLIQVIDQPVYPLKNDGHGKFKALVLGFLAGGLVAIFYLYLANVYKILSTD